MLTPSFNVHGRVLRVFYLPPIRWRGHQPDAHQPRPARLGADAREYPLHPAAGERMERKMHEASCFPGFLHLRWQTRGEGSYNRKTNMFAVEMLQLESMGGALGLSSVAHEQTSSAPLKRTMAPCRERVQPLVGTPLRGVGLLEYLSADSQQRADSLRPPAPPPPCPFALPCMTVRETNRQVLQAAACAFGFVVRYYFAGLVYGAPVAV